MNPRFQWGHLKEQWDNSEWISDPRKQVKSLWNNCYRDQVIKKPANVVSKAVVENNMFDDFMSTYKMWVTELTSMSNTAIEKQKFLLIFILSGVYKKHSRHNLCSSD